MIDRRSFLSSLGASAVLVGVPAFASQADTVVHGSRTSISLNGEWEHRIDGTLYDKVTVPSSRRPSGYYSLNRSLNIPKLAAGQRSFVRFEAVTYFGRVTVNGKVIGTMGPYVPYEFEFTEVAKEGKNDLLVEIADLAPLPDGSGAAEVRLGIHRGWEGYGGIIRDVNAEVRPAAFVENIRLAYKLSDDFGACSGSPRVMVSSAEAASGTVEIVLTRAGREVARAGKSVQLKPGSNDVELTFELKDPALWSPDAPNLYELTAILKTSAAEDSWSCKTGFRDVRTEGREFRLNGKKLVLNGVCRHDMWREQGFTLTRAQQEQDMRMIKLQGCNFIRLVHYPHDRHIIELADQLGLLVSEEPGYWGMDFNTMERSRIELGFTIIETIIRRDWNSPSVMAWLLSNECRLTEAFLAEGKQRCNRLDPIKRLVSAANDKSATKVKAMFVGAGMDFFDQHPYTYDVEDFAKEAEYDGPSKPLTFTEWGGKAIGQSGIVMRNTVDRLMDLVESGELSGHMFWSWQDMRQYSRIDGEMRDGILESGVVTESREPRDVVAMELTRLFELRRHAIEQPDAAPELVPLKWAPWSKKNSFEPIDLQSLVEGAAADRAWGSFKDRMAKYWEKTAKTQWKRTGEDFLLWQQDKVEIGGVEFQFPLVNERVRPLILTQESSEIVVPVKGPCQRLHILGQVTLGEGFPLTGKDGDKVATYTLEYSRGKTHEIPLRNGYEIAQANFIKDAGRLDPTATEAQRALIYVKDIAREQYQILLYSIPVEGAGLVRLRCKLNGEQPPLAIFAVTAERA
jgi:hypothetical protein